MERMIAKQGGVSGGGFIVLLAAIVVSVLLLLKLFPVYMEHFNVTTSLNSLSNESGVKEMKNSAIKTLLERRFSINEVDNVTRENITIEKVKGDMTIDIKYEVRKPLVGNIDIVIYFNDQLKL